MQLCAWLMGWPQTAVPVYPNLAGGLGRFWPSAGSRSDWCLRPKCLEHCRPCSTEVLKARQLKGPLRHLEEPVQSRKSLSRQPSRQLGLPFGTPSLTGSRLSTNFEDLSRAEVCNRENVAKRRSCGDRGCFDQCCCDGQHQIRPRDSIVELLSNA